MSAQDTKELRVGPSENAKRIMYLAKEFLINNEQIDVVSGTAGAPVATKAAENLVRLNYVTYEDIRTETNIIEGARRTKLVIRLKKTSDFNKLYEENEANRKKLQEAQEAKEVTPAQKKD
jgi:hypothetical protein